MPPAGRFFEKKLRKKRFGCIAFCGSAPTGLNHKRRCLFVGSEPVGMPMHSNGPKQFFIYPYHQNVPFCYLKIAAIVRDRRMEKEQGKEFTTKRGRARRKRRASGGQGLSPWNPGSRMLQPSCLGLSHSLTGVALEQRFWFLPPPSCSPKGASWFIFYSLIMRSDSLNQEHLF